MRSTRIVAAVCAATAALAGAGRALAGDDALAPSVDEVHAATASVPHDVGVGRLDLRALLAMAPEDAPPSPTPPVPRTEPGVTVYGERPGTTAATMAERVPYGGGWSPTGLSEDTRLGPAGQPEWTTERRWARVRSYVIAPGQVEFESWYRGRYMKSGQGEDRNIFQEELSVGLPHRFQVDLYLNFEHEDSDHFHFTETQAEARWALADWDCLPWNPTLYAEYKLHDDPSEPDVAEFKVLFSKDLAPRWKAGVNLTYEKELKGEEEEIFGTTAALSYTVCDQRLSVGAEFQWERATVESARNDPENTFYAGPSVQIRFNEITHLDIAPLFGLNDASQRMQLFIVFGIEIGGSGGEGGWLNPISASSR